MQPKPVWQDAVNPDRIMRTSMDGVDCVKFTVLKSDPPLAWDAANANRGPGGDFSRRATISFAPADPAHKSQGEYNVEPGMMQTYGIRAYFKTGWPMNAKVQHDWNVPWQMHLPDNYKGNYYDGFRSVSVHNGFITLEVPGDPNGSYFYTQQIKTGAWEPHQYFLGVNYSRKSDGWVKFVRATDYQVLARWDGPTFPTGVTADGSPMYMYGPLIGLYRGFFADAALNADATIYLAGFDGPYPDIWDGDMTVRKPTSPAPAPTLSLPPPPDVGDLVANLRHLSEQALDAATALETALKIWPK